MSKSARNATNLLLTTTDADCTSQGRDLLNRSLLDGCLPGEHRLCSGKRLCTADLLRQSVAVY